MLTLLLSVLVGVVLGLLGGGGSILTVPILLSAAKLPEREAIASSLFVVGVTSAAAVIGHARRGNVDWRTGLLFASAGAAGAFAGGRASELVPASWLILGFVAMMIGTGVAMLRGRGDGAEGRTPAVPTVLVTGAVLGFVTGLVGAGGGFVVVPALVLVGGLPMKKAVGTSLVVITLQTLAGFVGHAAHVSLDWPLTLAVTLAAVFGSGIGGLLSSRVPASALRRGFGVFVLGMAVWMTWQQAHAPEVPASAEVREH
jgi:uncharacterized membrane protein YfcA